jgi:hypothetical protein
LIALFPRDLIVGAALASGYLGAVVALMFGAWRSFVERRDDILMRYIMRAVIKIEQINKYIQYDPCKTRLSVFS